MNGHLSDEQWVAAVLNRDEGAVALHLAECAACRKEVTSFAAASAAAQAHARKVSERPESFWRQQRESIHFRLGTGEVTRPWQRWIWVTATMTLILLSSTLLTRNDTQPAPTAAPTDPDDVLLFRVQQSIRSDLPEALRPAALLTEEMVRAETTRRNP